MKKVSSVVSRDEYVQELREIFAKFLDSKRTDVDERRLISGINKLEVKIRKETIGPKKNAGLWFRFFDNDTGANTARRLERDLQYPHMPNYKYAIECMEIAIIPDAGIKIYFS